jgi:hypothetical protein
MKQYLIINRLYSVVCHLSSVICPRHLYNCRESSTNRPFFAKQTQCQVHQNQRKLFYNKYICESGHLVKSEKQSQNKANLVRRRRIAKMNLKSLAKKSGHTLLWTYLILFLTPPGQTVKVPPSNLNLLYYLRKEFTWRL